ncbi:hypothetical protein H5410_056334 [Solanum commersonii]|uniref:Uncharacterized protein n=1 Tax=Solanum commersonii TaxID=4109 RepID=A0A9J5WME9_SOLCO|nr:hypothetical protein H5410_056334 [Solanum commersonii]
MTSLSKNLNLAIIPSENQESPFIFPDVMLIDSFDITHHAYPLMEEASIQGDERYQSLVSNSSENMVVYLSGKPIATFVDSPQEDPFSEPSVAIPVRLNRSVQRDLDAVLHTNSAKKSRGEKSKFVPPLNPIYIIDDINTCFGVGEFLILLQAQGWNALFLQGNRRRKMGRKETREFYINVVRSAFFISSKFGGMSFTLTFEKQSKILGNWPPLEGLSLAPEISRRFANDPILEDYTRVDKGFMLPLHMLLVDVVHKIILPRKQKGTEVNYLDFTLMELLISQVQINLPQLILSHIHRICVQDNKDHGHGSVKKWQVQTTTNVLGEVDHAAIPATSRGENSPIQCLRTSLTAKGDYGLEHVGLVEENSRLKEELAKTQETLDTERSSNSAHLNHIVDFLAKGSPSSSSFVQPYV